LQRRYIANIIIKLPERLMSKYGYVILFIILLILVNCTDINSPNQLKFSGITETSENGPEPIGNIDSTDWLPRFHYFTGDSTLGVYSISVKPAFPNPTTRYTTLEYLIPAMDSIGIWIIDKYGNKSVIKSEYMKAGRFEEKIDLLYDTKGNMRSPDTYRIFFKVFTREEVPLVKGDVKLIK
jgi:hypothetical protein